MTQLTITARSVLFVWLIALSAAASPFKTPHVEAELISLNGAIQPGTAVQLALRLKIVDHWHTYWKNPGDSGLPTRLAWKLPDGFSAGPIQWPHPKRLPLGPLMNFGYEGEVLHLVTVQAPQKIAVGNAITLNARADWLVCYEVCIPEGAELSMTLPVVATAPKADARWSEAFAAAHRALPGELTGWTTSAAIADGQLAIDLVPPAGSTTPIAEAFFYPLREDLIANAAKQSWAKSGSGYRLQVPIAGQVGTSLTSIDGVIVAVSDWGNAHRGKAVAISAPLTHAEANNPSRSVVTGPIVPAAEQLSLVAALLFALVGGLLLNLMPCVFPVLGIKVMGFARHADSDPALMRKQGVAFLSGVVISFWVLAAILIGMRAAGELIGWGFQLQSPLFVTMLAVLFMLMALNLSGVFELGGKLQSAAGRLEVTGNRNKLLDAFLTGVLATVVATPCTAPFMGAALGFTLAQPASVSILVFTALALGMALPVLVLSLFPRWLRYLPKPGQWMETLKQFLAFPLYATVAWLVWVLGSQRGNDGVASLMFGLVLVALAAWVYGKWQATKPARAIVVGLLVALCGLALAWPGSIRNDSAKAATDTGWIPYSTKTLESLRAQNRAIFVDFTATWCITCQVNKRVALNQDEVVRRFKELDIVRMKADWTLQDPEITKALASFGRNGVPLYVFYPATGEPRVLPELLTPDIVLSIIGSGNPLPGK